MSETKPTGEQIRFRSANTGDHVLDTYLESAEIGGRTLTDLLDDLFDPSNNGVFRSDNFEFRFDSNKIQFRVGQFASSTAGFTDVTTFFAIKGTFSTSTAYNNFDVVTTSDKDVYIVHGLSTATTYTSESNFISSANTTKIVDVSEAKDWAIKTDGIVSSTGYSAKAWAVGGTGVDNQSSGGAAKDWATKTGGTVDGSDFSAKHYATTGNVATVSGAISNINTLAGINSAISTVSGISNNVTSVANIASNVTSVAGNETNINTTAGLSSNINTVAGISSNITSVAGISANVTSVANIASNVTSVAGISSLITSDFATKMNLVTSDFVTDMSVVTSDFIADLNSLATTPIIQDLDLLATTDFISDLNAVEGIKANVTSVANNSSNINSVAGNATNINAVAGDATDIGTVATDIANVSTVAGISSNVTTVAGISANVTSVAGNATNINTVASANANINTVAGVSSDITTVAGISSDVQAVENIASNVTTVAGMSTAINTVNSNSSNVNTVAGAITNVNNVGGSIANVNTVASNLSGVNSFGERYRVGASNPGSSNDAGDLFFNTTSNALNYFDGSSYQAIVAGAMTSLSTDSSPQLGGDLDVNGNAIISASNGNIAITPNGSGKVVIDGLSHPTADGSNGQFLKTDGSGQLSFATVNTDLSNDTTPQLGGNLDVSGNSIVSVSNGNISITPNGSGKVILDGLSHPTSDGSAGQFLKTDGGGNLAFATVTTDLSGDSTPQLGGNLDVNGNSIVSVSNGNIAITPNGTGKVILDGLSHPTADGSAGQFLKTDGSGNLSFQTVATSLSGDSSPELGANLDVVTHSIISTSNRNIAITPNGTGKVVLDGISYPTADGSANQVLQTDGSGTLSFGTVDLSVKANIASPTFTGTPAVPTASANTNSTQIASTAFVQQEIGQIIVFEAVSNPDPVAGDFTNGALFVGQF